MIWLAEHILALVIIVFGSMALGRWLRYCWRAVPWFRSAAASLAAIGGMILVFLGYFFLFATPAGWAVMTVKLILRPGVPPWR